MERQAHPRCACGGLRDSLDQRRVVVAHALTRVDTGYHVIASAGYGARGRRRRRRRRRASARNRARRDDDRHAVVHRREQRVGRASSRSCTCRALRLPATASARSSPANAKGRRPSCRCGSAACRPRAPASTRRSRRRESGSDAAGAPCGTTASRASVSARALIILAPIDGSFAQRGTSPQRTCASSRSPDVAMRMTGTSCIGAML